MISVVPRAGADLVGPRPGGEDVGAAPGVEALRHARVLRGVGPRRVDDVGAVVGGEAQARVVGHVAARDEALDRTAGADREPRAAQARRERELPRVAGLEAGGGDADDVDDAGGEVDVGPVVLEAGRRGRGGEDQQGENGGEDETHAHEDARPAALFPAPARLPERRQPLARLRLPFVGEVEAHRLEPVGHVLLVIDVTRVPVRVVVAAAAPELARRGVRGRLERRRGRLRAGLADVAVDLAERALHGIRLRRQRQVDRRLRERELRLRQPDVLDRVGRRHRDRQRLGVGVSGRPRRRG